MTSTPFGPVNSRRVALVIDEIARVVCEYHDEPFPAMAALIEVMVWRAIQGQTTEQITHYLIANATPNLRHEFVVWVITEARHRVGDKHADERGRGRSR